MYVVVTAGPARSGKSFFLNNLLGLPQGAGGFKMGHGLDGVTKGMWIYTQPETMTVDGDDLVVLHIDTEGFDDAGKLESYDPKVRVVCGSHAPIPCRALLRPAHTAASATAF